jgi:hypothetical protein
VLVLQILSDLFYLCSKYLHNPSRGGKSFELSLAYLGIFEDVHDLRQ